MRAWHSRASRHIRETHGWMRLPKPCQAPDLGLLTCSRTGGVCHTDETLPSVAEVTTGRALRVAS